MGGRVTMRLGRRFQEWTVALLSHASVHTRRFRRPTKAWKMNVRFLVNQGSCTKDVFKNGQFLPHLHTYLTFVKLCLPQIPPPPEWRTSEILRHMRF